MAGFSEFQCSSKQEKNLEILILISFYQIVFAIYRPIALNCFPHGRHMVGSRENE